MTTTNDNANPTTTQRDWSDLKPGDVIRFGNGWFEFFDACPSGCDTVTVKLIVRAPKAPSRIESHSVRTTGSQATCRI